MNPFPSSRRHFLGLAASTTAIASVNSATPRAFAERSITGVETPELFPLDKLMAEFVETHKIPGASLAVSRNSQLVYARGFGFADRDRLEPVQPSSLFRIASISKTITATAIVQRIAKRQLSPQSKIVDLLSLDNFADPRWNAITLDHLLHHTGGWDKDASFDPLFYAPRIAQHLKVDLPIENSHVLEYMLARPLDFDPGSRFTYANFGYLLLGLVLEKQSGEPYEKYVQNNVFKPLGITNARSGRTSDDLRAANEVRYYDQQSRKSRSQAEPSRMEVDWPYGQYLMEIKAASGGWIASAVDLVRFASDFDQPRRSRLLPERAIQWMFSPPEGAAGFDAPGKPKTAYYSAGWRVRRIDNNRVNTFHTGLLTGTSSLLVRRHDGLNWAVLFNTDATQDGRYPIDLLDSQIHQTVNSIQRWPRRDLFRQYL